MAQQDQQHVIEVRAGIGVPSAVNLTRGHQLGPLSLGLAGSWKISAAGVLDLHGYLYFNGTDLFLQSTNASSPLTFQGAPVPLGQWTAARGEGEIGAGMARLWIRSAAHTGPRSQDSEA